MRLLALTCAALAAAPALAGNESRADAYAYDNGLVEVVADFSENAIYWCGAAQYALARSDRPDRLYVWQGPSPSRARPSQSSVKFGFTPPPQGRAGGFTTDVSQIGNSMSFTAALQSCNERSASG